MPAPPADAGNVAELRCGGCGGVFLARRRSPNSGTFETPPVPPIVPPVVSGLELAIRVWMLGALTWMHRVGTSVGAVGSLALGGFVPALGGWLRDEVESWEDVVHTQGGVWVRSQARDADDALGPVLGRYDAPLLFEELGAIARRLGSRPPRQVRLTYLPCCGVTAWGRTDALMIGLPLLDVLNVAELRAVLAHELAHLARGDATRAARATRFVETLGGALDAARPSLSPLRLWARICRHAGDILSAPIARSQEARADRAAATLAGGDAAAGALIKVALVQPLFREVLDHYDPDKPAGPNLYAFFRAFWSRLPDELQAAMRHRLLAASGPGTIEHGPHPALRDRLLLAQAYPPRSTGPGDLAPAASLLGDVEALEQMLHNRLFGIAAVTPSVFHRAGT